MLDAQGAVTQKTDAAAKVQFKAYCWGTNPDTSLTADRKTGQLNPSPGLSKLLGSGISTNAWKSNYYGYIEAK
jgi:hypothetical protein